MTPPKITTVHRMVNGTWMTMYDDGKWASWIGALLPGELAACGQTLDIPGGVRPGWWGVPTDLPAPEPLPDLTMWCYSTMEQAAWWGSVLPHNYDPAVTRHLATLTVTTDPATGAPVATIERATR